MSDHATLSPSKRERWASCPASVRAEAAYPDVPSGAAAIDGTHSHTLLEWSVNNDCSPLTQVGVTLKDHEGEFIVTRDRAERVEIAWQYVQQRKEELK